MQRCAKSRLTRVISDGNVEARETLGAANLPQGWDATVCVILVASTL